MRVVHDLVHHSAPNLLRGPAEHLFGGRIQIQQTALDVDGVKALATLPSLDELRAKLLGLLVAPATKLAQLTTAPAAKLARVVGAYAAKDAA